MKKILCLVLFLFLIIFAPCTYAQSNSFVSVINPVRGNEFWSIQGQKPETAVLGQVGILTKYNLPTTWLIRFDALSDQNIIDALKDRFDEKGLFLEITPSLAKEAGVLYHQSNSWHAAGSAFLTGYEKDDRQKLIDTAFSKFKNIFGIYPASVGAWWIDSYSLAYMQEKYGIVSVLIVADQYSTDNYQIWGQYFGTPYYPSKNNALHPAQTLENKLSVVVTQWAARDPVNAYGNGVYESTFSLQANDYMDYHKLDTAYFSKLLDIYTKQQFNKFGHVVVGLENSYFWEKYKGEYEKQIAVLSRMQKANQIKMVSQKDFSSWYKNNFPGLSPEQVIMADDPLGSLKKVVWFMNPYYRAGLFINTEGSIFRDIRQYVDGEEELCRKVRCDSVNFATSATRVLDEVSFGHKWIIDQGKINDFKVTKENGNVAISYQNEAGNVRSIEFLPRDISVDGEIFSIDGAILNAVKKEGAISQKVAVSEGSLKWALPSVIIKLIKFLTFFIFGIIVPGAVISKHLLNRDAPSILRIFMSGIVGLVILSLIFYITSLVKMRPLVFVYIFINIILFLRLKIYNHFALPKIKPVDLILISIILAGTFFQVIPVFKSGLNFGYGVGFWGPNTHDGTWHMSLVNQLLKSVPPENPIYAGVILKNYHYFYDLLIAATNYFSAIPVYDLIFRFYPIIFSLMLGIGSYHLVKNLFKSRLACFFSLYLIYFGGSFGWIVEFLRERHFGGESAFWVNQSVSFNLNPPFAVSLVIIIAILHIIFNLSGSTKKMNTFLAILLAGSLIGFKSYGAILVLASLFFVGLIKRRLDYLVIFAGAVLISGLIFLPNFDVTSGLLILTPFWFIHSMVDSPDRVGWVRLSLAREAGLASGNWFKFISAEVISLVIFIAGNLGVRVVSLISIIKIKKILKDERLLFIFIIAFFSFLTPILFVQSGNPWNTIQFSYYGLYIAALISGGIISAILFLPKYLLIPILLALFIFAPVNSFVTAGGYSGKTPHAYVSNSEREALEFLSKQPDGVVLTYPYDKVLKTKLPEPWPLFVYDSTAYVSAYSLKSVYLEDEPQNQILLTEYKKRLVASYDFFLKPLLDSSNFLLDNNIQYVYLPKIFNVRLDESISVIKNVFENEEVVIYKIN